MKYMALVLSSLMLVACGGGGGGGGGSSTPPVVVDPNLTVPFQTAVANLVNNGFSKPFTISGWIDHSSSRTEISGSGTFTSGTPVGATDPNNGAALLKVTQVITGTQTAGGASTPFSQTGVLWFNSSNYTQWGMKINGESTIFSAYTYPATVKAGSTGSLGSGTTGGFLATTSTETYSVTSDSATSLLVTIFNSTLAFGGGAGETRTQTVYRVNTVGGISLVSVTTQNIILGSLYKSIVFTF